jgi:hypothetical protein
MCLSWPPVRTPYYRPTTRHVRNNHHRWSNISISLSQSARASGGCLPRIHAAAEAVTMPVIIVLRQVREGERNCQDGSITDSATE